MKLYLILIIILISGSAAYSQQFHTADILSPGQFSIGVNPVLQDKANLQSGIYVHGGMGLNRTMDLSLKIGVLEGSDYYGGDIEWIIRNRDNLSLSLFTGAHLKYFFGLDAGLNASMPLSKAIQFFTGVDLDVNFELEIEHYIWIPIGIEGFVRDNISLIFEIDLPMSEWAWSIYGGGIVFYL